MKDSKHFTKDGLFRISMQYFAESADSGTGDTGNNSGSGNNADNQNGATDTDNDNNNDNNNSNTVDIEKLVQARADKLTAESGKKIAALQKELENLKKANMTAEEVKKLEMSQKEEELAEREKMILDKENRLTAIKAIKAAGLDDGSDMSLELVDFVIADTEDAINNKVKAFGNLVKKFVKSEVDKTFKQNGRSPNAGATGTDDGKGNNSLADRLGKERAERQKKSNDVLNFYTGGKQ